jgi:hypothetical protein
MTQMPLYDGPFGQRYSASDFVDASKRFSSPITALPGLPPYCPRSTGTDLVSQIRENQRNHVNGILETLKKNIENARRMEMAESREALRRIRQGYEESMRVISEEHKKRFLV